MSRVILGLILGLVMATIGLYWWQGKAEVEMYAPPLPEPEEVPQNRDELPVSDSNEMTGPTPPEASELTREQRRFFRYDRNRDWLFHISKQESIIHCCEQLLQQVGIAASTF